MVAIFEDLLYLSKLASVRSRRRGRYRFFFANRQEFGRIYYEVFTDESYYFQADTAEPVILDCGAHIGLSVLYFKQLYPRARVVAFEPNPDVFDLLRLNIAQNELADVELVNAAVADVDGAIPFYLRKGGTRGWTWGGAGVKYPWHASTDYRTTTVPAVRLGPYLAGEIDLLKLDVEGMEGTVLADIEPALSRVKEIVLEFHGSSTNDSNDLDRVLAILERAGFGSTIKQAERWVTPDQVDRSDPFWLTIYARRA